MPRWQCHSGTATLAAGPLEDRCPTTVSLFEGSWAGRVRCACCWLGVGSALAMSLPPPRPPAFPPACLPACPSWVQWSVALPRTCFSSVPASTCGTADVISPAGVPPFPVCDTSGRLATPAPAQWQPPGPRPSPSPLGSLPAPAQCATPSGRLSAPPQRQPPCGCRLRPATSQPPESGPGDPRPSRAPPPM